MPQEAKQANGFFAKRRLMGFENRDLRGLKSTCHDRSDRGSD